VGSRRIARGVSLVRTAKKWCQNKSPRTNEITFQGGIRRAVWADKMKKLATVLILLIVSLTAWAQNNIYRCGSVYDNPPHEVAMARGCKQVSGSLPNPKAEEVSSTPSVASPEKSSSTPSAILEPARTPLGFLARRAGAYLGVTEYIRVFKTTDCGYALKRNFPTFETALQDEVISTFPLEFRGEVAKSMKGARQEVLNQANLYVNEMVDSLKREHDRNTACGLAAGNLASVFAQAHANWVVEKRRYVGSLK
jgi:hypothetical protein